MPRYAISEPPAGYFVAGVEGEYIAGVILPHRWLQPDKDGQPRRFTKRYLAVMACEADQAARTNKKRG